MDSNRFKRIQTDSIGFKQIQVDSSGFKLIQADSNGSNGSAVLHASLMPLFPRPELGPKFSFPDSNGHDD